MAEGGDVRLPRARPLAVIDSRPATDALVLLGLPPAWLTPDV